LKPIRDEFLSEEDLDLRNLSREELFECWNQWLIQAQATNDADEDSYSHGVFTEMPAGGPQSLRVADADQDYRTPAREEGKET
jgi:hypothetical protein